MEKFNKKSKIPENPQNGRAPRASRAAHTHFWGIFLVFCFFLGDFF